jgi:hypothetical protein
MLCKEIYNAVEKYCAKHDIKFESNNDKLLLDALTRKYDIYGYTFANKYYLVLFKNRGGKYQYSGITAKPNFSEFNTNTYKLISFITLLRSETLTNLLS